MVRSYLRHEPTAAFGVICSNGASSILDSDGKTAYVPALEDILVWDVRRGEQVAMWHETGHRSQVTSLTRCQAPDSSNIFAVGYEDGSVRIWDAETSTATLTFHGHKRAVTALAFDPQGMRLASASQDTTIILWDLVAETGLNRLKGHRDAITSLAFVRGPSSQNATGQASTSAAATNSHTEASQSDYLLSTSKDSLLKIWDLTLQHCIETTLAGKGELWSLAVMEDASASPGDSARRDTLILTGGSEGEIKAWLLSGEALAAGIGGLTATDVEATESSPRKLLLALGNVDVSAKRRVTQMSFGGSTKAGPSYLAISSSDRTVQVFRLREEEEMRKKLARRRRRQKEKEAANATSSRQSKQDKGAEESTEGQEVTWLDRIEPYSIIRPESGRLRSFAFADVGSNASGSRSSSHGASVPLLCATNANSLEIFSIPSPPKSKEDKKASGASEPQMSCSLELPGHRSEVRALSLSSDDTLLASADSAGTLKVWNVKTNRCIRTMSCGYALTVSWLPGDRYIVVGCKDGSIMTYDVPAGENVETIKAHEGPVWSIALHPDGHQCVSASADKDVKFWEFEMQDVVDEFQSGDDAGAGAEENSGRIRRQQLALAHVRTLKMTDDVLFARYSPNGKLLALSLLDNTVKVFYADSLKFFLSLYGHKLPVLSLDISADSKLCVTCSADKNVKIWGLDYGDCHRSLFAHQDSIMSVAFERGMQGGGLLGGREGESHHFWTIGKDGVAKYWDGDRFELIQTMEGHHGEVWSLAVGGRGTMVVTSGADRCMRVWEKTEEPLFLEEEREREQERLFDQADREARERQDGQVGAVGSLAGGQADGAAGAEEQQEATAVTNATTQSLMAGERLMEALDVADEDRAARRDWIRGGRRGPAPVRNALVTVTLGENIKDDGDGDGDGEGDVVVERFVLATLQHILPAQLDDALLTLPFDKVVSLMRYLDLITRHQRGASANSSMALVSRVLFFLLRQHHAQIVSNTVMRTTLVGLRTNLARLLRRQKTTVGYNLAALRQLKQEDVSRRTAALYESTGLGLGDGGENEDALIRRKVAEAGGVRKRKAALA
ncbi:unnamed protein product [Parajaminaea phylloscopi]